jgi:hypothetical protein
MPTPKPQEPHDDYIQRCMSDQESVDSFPDEEQRYAVCESMWDEVKQTAYSKYRQAFAEPSYSDYPQAATDNAKIALRWADENGWGSCGTAVGKARANQLAKGEPITRDTIARMAGFERHRQNSDKELGDGCGRLMWLAWGGNEGVEWAQRKLKQIDNGKA